MLELPECSSQENQCKDIAHTSSYATEPDYDQLLLDGQMLVAEYRTTMKSV
jgi:hypothetical protein